MYKYPDPKTAYELKKAQLKGKVDWVYDELVTVAKHYFPDLVIDSDPDVTVARIKERLALIELEKTSKV